MPELLLYLDALETDTRHFYKSQIEKIHAIYELMISDLTRLYMIVVDIAMAVGYENASKFSMAFRKGMDRNSLDYRKYAIQTEVNPNEE